MGEALSLLGYKVMGSFGVGDPDISVTALPRALRFAEEFDAFRDNPWPILFRDLDRSFPGSKFILTERSTKSWIESAVRYFGRRSTPMREWIYGVGSPLGNEDVYAARLEQHNVEVKSFFADRPDDLLVLQLTQGEGWEKLCEFLGRQAPAMDFPHSNRA